MEHDPREGSSQPRRRDAVAVVERRPVCAPGATPTETAPALALEDEVDDRGRM